MTEQEVFDAVWEGLAAQDWERSVTKYNTCKYRGPNNLKCAVGVLLTDEEAEGCDDYGSVRDLALGGKLPERLVPHIHLLAALQLAHDLSSAPRDMRVRLRIAGEARGLKTKQEWDGY